MEWSPVDGQYGSTYCISFLHTHLLPSILLCGVPATLKAGVAGEGYLLHYSHESND